MRRALLVLGVLLCGAAVGADPTVPGNSVTRVAIFAGEGASKSRGPTAEVVDGTPGFKSTLITADDIRADKLKEFQVVIFPGGSGKAQANDMGAEGREKVKNFVKDGGGYVGICAGAYLASRSYNWSLHILDAEVLDREHWARGTGKVDLKICPTGKDFFRVNGDTVNIYYGQGPLLAPGKDSGIPDYEELATYETEIHSKGGAQPGVMKGTTAAARSTYGDGRVFCWSPHPEKSTDETKAMFQKALLWAAKK